MSYDSAERLDPSQYRETALMLGKPRNRYRDHYEALYRIQRGLVGHISFLAAAEANGIFTEYLLYEPVLRILVTQGYAVNAEVPCKRKGKHKTGDFPRLDFRAEHGTLGSFSLEIKWPRLSDKQAQNEEEGTTVEPPKIKLGSDTLKLKEAVEKEGPSHKGFLCILGRFGHIGPQLNVLKSHQNDYEEPLMPMIASFLRTRITCRIFELKALGSPSATPVAVPASSASLSLSPTSNAGGDPLVK